MKKTAGILALQGDYAKHQSMLQKLGADTVLVRTKQDLDRCQGVIIPGGESTTLSLLLNKHGLWDEIVRFGADKTIFGTCAGLIMLSKKITREPVKTLQLIDIETARNAYGRQVNSFIDDIDIELDGSTHTLEGYFIRAPKIMAVEKGVNILAMHNDEIVMVEQGNIMAATFHPELSEDTLIHNYFLSKLQ